MSQQAPASSATKNNSVGNTQASAPTTSPIASSKAVDTLAWFDSLDPVSVEFMIGKWRGEGVPTHHPMDGLLENFNWYGKEFVSAEQVHPLVFQRSDDSLVKLNPQFMPLKYARNTVIVRQSWFKKLFELSTLVTKTKASKARLRLTEYRGKVSATMIYDDKPINDVFRKIDENTVLGVMDLKGMRQPFFFKLKRLA